MNTPKAIRSNIIELLFQVDDVQVLESIYKKAEETVQEVQYVHEGLYANTAKDDDILAIAKEPIPQYLTAEQIEEEQGGFSMEEFEKTVESIDFTIFEDESLEDMLNNLTK